MMRFQKLLPKEKSVLVRDINDEYYDNDDGSNDVDSDVPTPGFERVRDFDDYAMDVDTGKDIDDEMGDDNDCD